MQQNSANYGSLQFYYSECTVQKACIFTETLANLQMSSCLMHNTFLAKLVYFASHVG